MFTMMLVEQLIVGGVVSRMTWTVKLQELEPPPVRAVF